MSTPPLTLDPATTALVLIDLQYGIVGLNVQPQSGADVVARCRRLAEAFRGVNAPVVLVTVGSVGDGKDMLTPAADTPAPAGGARPANWSTVVEDLAPQASDLRIMKRQWGAFHGTELDLQLRRRGIRTIALAGISTNVGVESTARDAFERGYEQVFVGDAMAAPSGEAHANTLKFTFPRIGRIRTTDDVVAAMK